MICWPPHVDSALFLERHWQKAPLLMPGGTTGLGFLPSPEELAGLACEDDVESRLVSGDSVHGWRVREGPFEESDFLALPESGWTLLVQDVDKHLPDVAPLLEAFAFLPRWRLDDLMISYAAPGGSVGPHIDAYDVFLLQGVGTRTWELDCAPGAAPRRQDSELDVLACFEPDTRWSVEPGDIIYLPPGIAHFGHSDQPSMTCSIGFRAPSASEMFATTARWLESTANGHYRDPDLAPAEVDGSRLSSAAIERARHLLETAAANADSRMAELLGRLSTEVKPWLLPDPEEIQPDARSILDALSAGGKLERHRGSRFAWFEDTGTCWLFANGKSWLMPPGTAGFCRQVADGSHVGREHVNADETGIVRTLVGLVGDGCLRWSDETSIGSK
ncbi:MAG: cupin domain-containing protein [Gammaproteobacteria bacterium]|jgi:50S ribosomal protein L16 3-hydroxylase